MIHRPPVVIYGDCLLRRADQMMIRHGVGRLIVMDREEPSKILGIITRDDLLTAHRQRS
jgi:CBS domain-containing protein